MAKKLVSLFGGFRVGLGQLVQVGLAVRLLELADEVRAVVGVHLAEQPDRDVRVERLDEDLLLIGLESLEEVRRLLGGERLEDLSQETGFEVFEKLREVLGVEVLEEFRERVRVARERFEIGSEKCRKPHGQSMTWNRGGLLNLVEAPSLDPVDRPRWGSENPTEPGLWSGNLL